MRHPKRGDVVVFYRNDVNPSFQAEFAIGNDDRYEKLIKRVVALEGDKLWVETRGNDLILKIQTTDGVITENYYTVKGEKASFYDANGNITDIPYLGFAGNLKGTTRKIPLSFRKIASTQWATIGSQQQRIPVFWDNFHSHVCTAW